MPDLRFLTDGASVPKDSVCASFSKLYNPGTKPLTIDIRHRPSFRNICLGLIPFEARTDGQTVCHVPMILINTLSLSLSKNHVRRGVQWTYLMNESWKIMFFFLLPHTPTFKLPLFLSLSSFLTSTSIMTALLAGARWLPINNSHITQVQRGEPDEPPAGAHLLPACLRPIGVPTHSILSERAWHS